MPRLTVLGGAALVAIVVSGCGAGSADDASRPPVEELLERANGGDADALFNLGTRYAHGDGVARDNVTAYMWFLLAAEYSRTETRYQAERMQLVLDLEMFRHQIFEAERLARIWQEQRRIRQRR